MDSQEETEIKNIIRGLLISNPLRSTQQQLWKDFQEMIGRAVPLRKLGFPTFDQYLRSIPDVVHVYGNGPSGEVEAVSSKSQHINEMVQKQKKTFPKRRKFSPRPVPTFHRKSPHFFQNKSLVKFPPTTQQTFKPNVEPPLYSHNVDPVNNPSPQAAPVEKVYERYSHFNHKSPHHEENTNLGTNSNFTLAYSATAESQTHLNLSIGSCDDLKNFKTDSIRLSNEIDHASQVPVKVQNNLCNLIGSLPKGIECTQLPAEYRKMYNKNIHYEDYGYRSLIEMCSDLPKIFNYIQHSSHDYMLYDKKQPIPTQDLRKNTTKHVAVENVVKTHILEDLPNLNWATSSVLLPSDVFTINDQIDRCFPSDVQEDDILDITIAEIYDLSKFWFYMTFGDLDPLMDNLQTFFSKNNDAYRIPEVLLEEGLYCVAIYSGLYHRCVIVNMVPKYPDCVRVFFVDYGTVENVNSKDIWFLPKRFGEVPCQAFRGRLSNIYPVYENQPWSASAVRRLEKLVTNRVVVGKVTRVDEKEHFLELYLADITNKDKIFYLNKIFVDEGYALHIGDERKKSLVDHDCTPNVRYIHLYPEFYEIEAGLAPTTEEMKYIFVNRIPMHHYMPQYFDIYYNEDIKEILQDYERVGRKRKKNLIIPTVELEFDFSIFPDYLVDDIKELYLQDHPEAEMSVSPSPIKSEMSDSSTNRIKNELSVDADGEKKTIKSVPNGFCKRISEIRQGTTNAAKMERSDVKNSCDNSLLRKCSELEQSVERVPLTNIFQQLNVNNNDSGAISPSRARISTNPFLSDCNLNKTNPFRETNPFLSDLDETVDTSQLVDLFSKPAPQKIVNNLRDFNSCTCKKDKQINIERSGVCNPSHDPTCSSSITNVVVPISPTGSSENTNRRVRTPPGFSSTPVPSRPPAPLNNNFFISGPGGNPYYQRLQFQNTSLLQNPPPYGLPMHNNQFGCWPQMYSSPTNFNPVNWSPLFPQQYFGPPPRYPQ